MGRIKDWNVKDLTEAEEMTSIHIRPVQKGLNVPDNHNGVITHLEPDIPEYEVKRALGSIAINKASGGDE